MTNSLTNKIEKTLENLEILLDTDLEECKHQIIQNTSDINVDMENQLNKSILDLLLLYEKTALKISDYKIPLAKKMERERLITSIKSEFEQKRRLLEI